MSKFVYSSDQLPPGLSEKARFETWRGRFCEMFGNIDFRISEAPFGVETTFVKMSDALVGHCRGTVLSSEHSGKEGGACDRVGILINRSASAFHTVNRGRECLVSPGDAVFFVKRDDPRKIIGKDHYSEWIILDMPERSLLGTGGCIDDMIGTVIPGAGECMRLLSGYANLLIGQESVADASLGVHMVTTLADLTTLALRPARDAAVQASERGLRTARVDAILREIAEGYRDPAFSVTLVSRRLRLSVRTIQDLLQSSGVGFSERLMELRLAHAVRLLARPAQRSRKVSDIAFDCGFNDLSYFHRCFRRRYGMTPGGVRPT